MKNRATLVYILMVVVCASGLWVIVRAGSHLKAPPDLSGEWVVSASPVVAGLGDTMQVEQSGRYLRLTFAGGLVLDLKIVGDFSGETLHFAGNAWKMTATLPRPGEALAARLEGPTPAAFTARRPSEREKAAEPAGARPHAP